MLAIKDVVGHLIQIVLTYITVVEIFHTRDSIIILITGMLASSSIPQL